MIGRLCFHSLICHRLHELVDQLIILLSSDSFVFESNVKGVIEQSLDQKPIRDISNQFMMTRERQSDADGSDSFPL